MTSERNETSAKNKRRLLGRRNMKTGQRGEDIATKQLRLLGLAMVDEIHNGWQLVSWKDRSQNLAYVVPAKKVRGDRAAIVPGTGQRVLAEVKTFDEDNFNWSRLPPHQHNSLAENAALGGLSLVVWVRYGQVHVMEYTTLLEAGWKPRHSFSYEQAIACLWRGVDEREVLD